MARPVLPYLVGLPLFAGAIAAQHWQAELPTPLAWQTLLYDASRARIVRLGPPASAGPGTPFLAEYDGAAWQPRPTAHEPPRVRFVATLAAAWNRIVLVTTDGGPHQVWTYDGSDWTYVPTAHAPFPHWDTAIAFDSARQRLVLFGGDSIYSLVYDTWEFDGVDWQTVGVATPPPVRRNHSLGYDPLRQRIVLYGGQGSLFTFYRDTWEYDGLAWVQGVSTPQPLGLAGTMLWHPTLQCLLGVDRAGGLYEYRGAQWTLLTSCPARGPLAAYDGQRNVVVAHGGVYGPSYTSPLPPSHELWEWNGAWTRRTPLPPPTVAAAMTTDHAGERVLWYQDQSTWVRDAGGWQELPTPNTPTNVPAGCFAYDAARGCAVLFGGALASVPTPGFTWELRGATWSSVPTVNAPSVRQGAAITYDPARARVVLFGGDDGSTWTRYRDTWLFDGTDWQQANTPLAPPGRSRHTMAFHGRSGEVVLFGGDDGSATPRPDTWHFGATGWRQQFTPRAPFGAWDAALANDPWRGRLVLHGGTRGPGAAIDEVWEYDGSDWTPVVPTGDPLPRQSHGLAFDPVRGTMVVCSGLAEHSATHSNFPLPANSHDLVPAPLASWTRYGTGCAGGHGTPMLDAAPGALPQLGTVLPLQFDHLPPGPGLLWLAVGFGIGAWNGAPLPRPLASIGLPGCALWIAPAAGLGVAVAHGGNAASLGLPLPSSPALAGERFGLQAFVFDPSSPNGASVSNAGLAILR